ncbi:MAG: UDP-N-acetylmuramate dehydrogenase [Clostridia bacterium]|nr:UDP-N-acetylmuramate dehydrogenase [Clostridia bacterium]
MNKYNSVYDFALKNNCTAVFNEPMSKHTSFKIGGKASLFVSSADDTALIALLNKCREENARVFILGNGSNLLVSDEGIDAVVISMCRETDDITVSPDGVIRCSAGVSLMKVCRAALQHSLSGLEFAFGIPGSVGGAVYMNAGAYGGEIKDVITSCRAVSSDGEIAELKKEDMLLGYRTSIFNKNNYIILSAEFKLDKGNPDEIKAKMDDFMNRRKTKQPIEFPSAGSVFKRPEGYFAGALIEECGLKGKRIGGAEVSRKHSGFIINAGDATAEDVMALVDFIRETVKNEKGVLLEPEIKMIK